MATHDQTTDNGKSGSKLPVDTDKQVVSHSISRPTTAKIKAASTDNRQPLHLVIGWLRHSGCPVHFFYQVAVGGLISKMLYNLSALFGTKLTKQKNKAMIAAVLGGAHSEWVSVYLGG